jgi:DNA-binding Lrp family transcriptional regulator
MNLLAQQLIDRYQKGFPLTSRPYLAMAEEIGVSEQEVIFALEAMQVQRIITRVGPVFDHSKAGASTLVAMAVAHEELDSVAEQVNSFSGVNHNYAREHQYNLWFVVTAKDKADLYATIVAIEKTTGYPAMSLPMERSFHIDLGFKIDWEKSRCNS